jgi:endoglucanase
MALRRNAWLVKLGTGMGILLSGILLGACREKWDASDPSRQTLPEGRACPSAVGMISDGESGNKTSFVAGRGGYWYTFLDTKDNGGSEIWPTSGALGGTFEMSEGGANGTRHHARMRGSIGGADVVYAGMGLNFVDPKGAYDASRYGGIAFWAKKNPGSTPNVRVKVPDAQTDPDGKLCRQCFNDHGYSLTLSEQWTLYTIPFAEMRQEDWGPKDGGIDPRRLYGIQFQVSEKGAPFDISVDEIHFTGCE